MLNRTTFGRRTVAVGGNAEAARLAGIDVRRQRLYLYLLSGLCCGIAAFMLIVLSGSGQNTNGNLYELDAIAAAIIGGTLLSGGRGTITGSVLGVLVFTTITNIFALNNLQSDVQQIAKGAIIVAAVLVQQHVTASTTCIDTDQPTREGSTAMPESPAAEDCSSAPPPSRPAPSSPVAPATSPTTTSRPRTTSRAADDKPGKPVTIGFAGPQADHGWLNAINDNAKRARREVLGRHAGDHRGLQRHRRRRSARSRR